MTNVFSIDLEDWFHILDSDAAPPFEQWHAMESRVRGNTFRLLDVLERRCVRATFFVLGWIAETYPDLVREIAHAGHEIASHGYRHLLVFQHSAEVFRDDLRLAATAIQEASNIRPRGFRAPGFSITHSTPWAFDILLEEELAYDSSVFPVRRGHGGIPGAAPLPSVLPNGLRELPISTVRVGPRRVAYLGGGYLRAFPEYLVMRWAERQVRQGEPLILYIHPRDVDPGQPRLSLGRWRRFKSYTGLESCLTKVDTLLANFDWRPFGEYEWP